MSVPPHTRHRPSSTSRALQMRRWGLIFSSTSNPRYVSSISAYPEEVTIDLNRTCSLSFDSMTSVDKSRLCCSPTSPCLCDCDGHLPQYRLHRRCPLFIELEGEYVPAGARHIGSRSRECLACSSIAPILHRLVEGGRRYVVVSSLDSEVLLHYSLMFFRIDSAVFYYLQPLPIVRPLYRRFKRPLRVPQLHG